MYDLNWCVEFYIVIFVRPVQVGLSSLEGSGRGGQLSSCIDLLLVIEAVKNATSIFPFSDIEIIGLQN